MTGEGGAARFRGRWGAGAILAVGVLLFFHPLLLGEGELFFRDISLNHLPTRVYTTPILRAGHLPLWNPYLSGGMPLAANPNNLIFHPVTVLFLLLPVGVAFPASILLQVLLAGWGMFRWARESGRDEKAALAGGIVYAFSGGIASCGTFHNLLASWAWVPLALFAFARHRRTGSPAALAGSAAALAVTLLAGDPLAAGTVCFLALLECLPEESLSRPISGLGRPLLSLLMMIAGGTGLALIQILPTLELVAASGRGAGIPYADAAEWALPAARILEGVVPFLYGDVTAIRPTSYWGGPIFEKGYQFLLTVYCGAIPVLLAAAALAVRPRRRSGILLLAALALLAVALGDPAGVYPFLYRNLPLVASLRYPSRFLLPAFLFLSMLAATGLDGVLKEKNRTGAGAATRTLIGGSIFISLAAAVVAYSAPLRRGLVAGWMGIPARLGAEVQDAAAGALRIGFLRCAILAASAGLLALLLRRGRLGATAFSGALIALIAADLIQANYRLNPVIPPSFLSEAPPVLALRQEGDPAPRVFSENRPRNLAVWAKGDSAWWGYLWNHLTLRVCTGLPHRIPQAYQLSIDLLSPRLANDLAMAMTGLDANRVRRLCDLASAGLLMTYRDLPDPDLILESTVSGRTNVPLRIYRNRGALPRAYLVAAARPEQGPALEALTDPAFDPRSEVYLDRLASQRGEPGGAGEARLVEDSPERITVEVAASRSGWLVLTDNEYPGWQARVDGTPAPILRANYLFRAVEMPAGDHRVEFVYRPRTLVGGAIGSVLTLGALALGFRFAHRRTGPKGV